MQIARTMIEKYLYDEVEGVFRNTVDSYSMSYAREDIGIVYDNLKNLTVEINEEVVESQVLEYLNNSILWIEGSSYGEWTKTSLIDILTYIERNSEYVNNAMMEQLVGIINSIGNNRIVE